MWPLKSRQCGTGGGSYNMRSMGQNKEYRNSTKHMCLVMFDNDVGVI